MDEYYWSGGQRVPLQRDPEVMALKFRSGPVGRTPLDADAFQILRDRLVPAGFVGHRGIKIYRTPGQPRAVEVMARQHAVEFATPAYRRNVGNEELMFVTNQFLAKFKPEVTEARLAEINARHGIRIVGKLDYAENAYTLEAEAPGQDVIHLANLYREQEPTVWSHPVLVRRQSKKSAATTIAEDQTRDTGKKPDLTPKLRPGSARVVPADKRWHLGSAQTRVTEAWTLDGLEAGNERGAKAIRIAILDDGVDVDHPDFVGRVIAQFDFEDGVADVRPKSVGDNHGTACTGVAAAAGVGPASGAAPGCSIIAARTPSLLGVDEEARMFQWASDQGADVISCSWGPADGEGTTDPLPDNVAAALRYCVTKGRGGRGIPIFWAAGNGDESVSLDGYASCSDVIAVAASTNKNDRSWYSDFGPEVWICAPSSGDGDVGELSIFTTDRAGTAGYNVGDAELGDATGNYTGDFGGTSSAAPLSAGIAALVLSANPDLHENPTSPRGREVREIMAATAVKIGSGYTNGHSPNFGFGRIDAAAAVREALKRKAGDGGGVPEAVVDGPSRWVRDAGPPTLRVDPGAGRFYAVEFATDSAFFDADNRTAGPLPLSQFYASWDEAALLQAPSYPADWTMPELAWNELRVAPRLFYRIWGSDEASAWTRAVASTDDGDHASAPSLELVDFEEDRGIGTGSVVITAPANTPRSGASPTFLVSPGAGRHFAVEISTERDQLNHSDVAAASRRGPDSYFATWQLGGLLPAVSQPTSWRPPAEAWERLKTAPALYYRAWSSAQADRWADVLSSLSDEEASLHAPTIRIDADGRSIRQSGERGPGAKDGQGMVLRYPSGAEMAVQNPKKVRGGLSYEAPPEIPGAAPLVGVAYRLDRPLCTSFRVRDFASPLSDADDEKGEVFAYADYARIAPALVEALRKITSRTRMPIEIMTGYLHPALAAERAQLGKGGQALAWHVAGLAVDIRGRGERPLDLAQYVLQALGSSGIGIGLLPDGIHIDLRAGDAAWAEPGAEMDSASFVKWVGQVMVETGGGGLLRDERDVGPADTEARMQGRAEMPLSAASFSVVGPDVYPAGAIEPPVFYIEFTEQDACQVEVATSQDQLGSETKQSIRSDVLRQSELKEGTSWRLPPEAWSTMRGGANLYYRAVGAAGVGEASSSDRTQVGIVALSSGRTLRSKGRLQRQLPDANQTALQDELSWRGKGPIG
ncbi:S8 family serine peptidase [Belnapia moabensis]|uniref:S8 family serine peptidase n=1 Tax=Belnapia moabensis TaxID=365533 RepID=UPI0006941746|nr:S8 family serine peptidase [Belnapia moabensis]